MSPVETAVVGAAVRQATATPAVRHGYLQLPADQVRGILQRPAVAEAVADRVRQVLLEDGAPLAAALLVQTVANGDAPLKLRLHAADSILDRSGFGRSVPAAASDKPLHEMSASELEAAARMVAHEVAMRSAVEVGNGSLDGSIPDDAKRLFE